MARASEIILRCDFTLNSFTSILYSRHTAATISFCDRFLLQQEVETTAVLIGQKDQLTSIAAENDVIESTREMNARSACHFDRIIKFINLSSSKPDPTLPQNYLDDFSYCCYVYCMEYEWDEGKREANLRNHGVDFTSIYQFEWDSATIIEDTRREYQERRFVAYGLNDERLHCVVFMIRGKNVRIISLRKANKREARKYGS